MTHPVDSMLVGLKTEPRAEMRLQVSARFTGETQATLRSWQNAGTK